MRKFFIFMVALGMVLGISMFAAGLSKASEQKPQTVSITKTFDMFQLFKLGQSEEHPMLGDLKIISSGKKDKFSFTFPEHPVKVNFKMRLEMIKATFWKSEKGNAEEYTITLAGGSTAVEYEARLLKCNVDTIFYLILDTKFLKPQHFDTILSAWREAKDVEIEGYIYDKEKDFILGKKEDIDFFTIKIILHPVSINGEKLF